MPLIIPTNSISAVGYDVANSLRFDDGSSDYLNRTFASSGNRKTFTISTWFKRSGIGTQQEIISSHNGGNDEIALRLNSTNELRFYNYQTSGTNFNLQTNQVLRDTSAWYHVVLAVDTTQATSSNRIKIYLNGEQITSFSSETYPNQNIDLNWNMNNLHFIGLRGAFTNDYFDGYLAEVVNIDGTALDPTSFGEFDADTGIWKPIDVSGLTFGTNGFYLPFENSGALGQDDSGNGNNFTVNNLTSIDQTTDTPTNNYATFNPLLDVNNTPTLSEGNLKAQGQASGNARFSGSTISVANGKWYYEVKVTVSSSSPYVGVIDAQSNLRRNGTYFVNTASGDNDSGYAVNMSGDTYHNNSNSYATNIGSISTGDILGFAIDLDSGTKTCEIYKNGVSQRTFNLAEPSSGAYMLGCISIYNEASAIAEINYGSPPFTISSGNSDGNGYGNFEYSVPSGYYALNTKNLAEYG